MTLIVWPNPEFETLSLRYFAASPRDRNTVVDWDKLRRVLDDVVGGHPGYTATTSALDAPHYTDSEER